MFSFIDFFFEDWIMFRFEGDQANVGGITFVAGASVRDCAVPMALNTVNHWAAASLIS